MIEGACGSESERETHTRKRPGVQQCSTEQSGQRREREIETERGNAGWGGGVGGS